jgi:hypothetical protein
MAMPRRRWIRISRRCTRLQRFERPLVLGKRESTPHLRLKATVEVYPNAESFQL